MATVQRSNRRFTIKASDNGNILEMGPAANATSVGVMVIQFNPDQSSDYEATVMGRCFGQNAADCPYVPIPYRRVTLNNIASDYAVVHDAITGASLIQVPANWAIALLVSCTAGSCVVASQDLLGNSTP